MGKERLKCAAECQSALFCSNFSTSSTLVVANDQAPFGQVACQVTAVRCDDVSQVLRRAVFAETTSLAANLHVACDVPMRQSKQKPLFETPKAYIYNAHALRRTHSSFFECSTMPPEVTSPPPKTSEERLRLSMQLGKHRVCIQKLD